MKEPFIFLCPEITREHAFTLMDWARSGDVMHYLSDAPDAADDIADMLARVNLPVVTHIFNRTGRLYMACEDSGRPIGFARLADRPDASEAEAVVAIGDKKRWGFGYGTQIIRGLLKTAFYELRYKRIIAKIHAENIRSARAFAKAGFKPVSESSDYIIYAVTFEEYKTLCAAKQSAEDTIFVTELDLRRLRNLLKSHSAKELEEELSRADIVSPGTVPEVTVTMNSRVRIKLDDEERDITLVYPEEADFEGDKISVLSPVGTAILGYCSGETVCRETPDGCMEIIIDEILYQPEAAGDWEL